MVLLSARPSASEQPQTLKAIHVLVEKNANASKLPIIANWDEGKVAIGNERDANRIL